MTDSQEEKIKRLISIRNHFRYSQKEMAEILGLKQPNLSAIENGKAGRDILIYIPYILQVELNVSRTWFNTGEGEQFVVNRTDTPELDHEVIASYKDIVNSQAALIEKMQKELERLHDEIDRNYKIIDMIMKIAESKDNGDEANEVSKNAS